MKIKNLNVKNIRLFFKGYYKAFINNQYSKLFKAQDMVVLMTEAARHAPCVLKGEMECCGCATIPKLMAGGKCEFKKCKHDSSDI